MGGLEYALYSVHTKLMHCGSHVGDDELHAQVLKELRYLNEKYVK